MGRTRSAPRPGSRGGAEPATDLLATATMPGRPDLRAGAGDADASTRPADSATPPADWLRRRVGRYRLIEPLGAGGQAVVWRAAADGPEADEVALKLVPAAGDHPRRRVVRLLREARRGARWDHPHLLPVLDSGLAGGAAFLVMPLVDGGSLADLIARRRRHPGGQAGADHRLARLPGPAYVRAAAGALARVARALQAAHDAGVAHRDVKPANVLVDRDGRAFLADFGLARDLDVATPEQLRDGAGSPPYMAPEKLRGRAADERRCDVYALGATLYEAVTLARPQADPGPLPVPALWAELARRVPPPPRSVAPGISPALEAVVMRAMAADPSERHPRADALAADLERFLAGGPGVVGGS